MVPVFLSTVHHSVTGGGSGGEGKLYSGKQYIWSHAHGACRPVKKTGVKQTATNDLLSLYK